MLYHFLFDPLIFLIWGRTVRLRWMTEKWLYTVLSPFRWQLIQPKRKNTMVYKYCLLCFGLAHLVCGLAKSDVFKVEDVPVKLKSQCILVPPADRRWGAFSYWHVLKCQKSEGVHTDLQKHHRAVHRYFINTYVAVELSSRFQVQFLKCYLTTKQRDWEEMV